MKKREARDLRVAESMIKTATPAELTTRGPKLPAELEADRARRPKVYWPVGAERPTKFPRRPVRPYLPCEKCDRTRTDFGTRAVVCRGGMSERAGKAYLECVCCGHRFSLPLEDAPGVPT